MCTQYKGVGNVLLELSSLLKAKMCEPGMLLSKWDCSVTCICVFIAVKITVIFVLFVSQLAVDNSLSFFFFFLFFYIDYMDPDVLCSQKGR